MLENTGVWVCTVCGFVYVGDIARSYVRCVRFPVGNLRKMEGRLIWLKKYAVEIFALVQAKDCLCLYVCPTGADWIQRTASLILKSGIRLGARAEACPSLCNLYGSERTAANIAIRRKVVKHFSA